MEVAGAGDGEVRLAGPADDRARASAKRGLESLRHRREGEAGADWGRQVVAACSGAGEGKEEGRGGRHCWRVTEEKDEIGQGSCRGSLVARGGDEGDSGGLVEG